MEETAPHFDLSIAPDKVEEEFFQILEKIKPSWETEFIVFERSPIQASRGLLNTMVKCYSTKDPLDALMIRIHNTQMSEWLDRNVEVKCLKHLQPLDCAPKIVATFTNGFCYEYLQGEVLSHDKLKDDPIWKLIAIEFAKFHSADLNDGSKEEAGNKLEEMIDKIWVMYPEELKNPEKNEKFKKEFPPKDEFKAEIDSIIKHCKDLNSQIVLCHNDVRAENIIWNEEEQKIHFVDFEAMNYGAQANELAAHFTRYCGMAPPDPTLYPSEEFQMEFLRHYLEKYYELTFKRSKDVTEIDVRRLYFQVTKYQLVQMLVAALAGPAFEDTNIFNDPQIDFFEFSLVIMREYRKKKDQILAMTLPQ